MGNLVAINLFDGEKIINKKKVPYLFYWDCTVDIKSALQSDETFVKYLTENLVTIDKYSTANLSYFFFIFNENTNEEIYKDCSEQLQTWYPISNSISLIEELIKYHFNYLYKCSYKNDYEFNNVFEIDICNIYDLLKDRYPAKIAKTTVINYVRAELINTNKLISDNVNCVIAYIEKILVNKE